MPDRLPRPTRPLYWIASSRKDYAGFPSEVQEVFGFELFLAQTGLHPPSAKMLKGIGPGVLELVEEFAGDAYRTVYAVCFDEAVYVLHCFKKKSKSGIKTPQVEIDLVKRRLRDAIDDYAARTARRQ
jgi:phage-related protein